MAPRMIPPPDEGRLPVAPADLPADTAFEMDLCAQVMLLHEKHDILEQKHNKEIELLQYISKGISKLVRGRKKPNLVGAGSEPQGMRLSMSDPFDRGFAGWESQASFCSSRGTQARPSGISTLFALPEAGLAECRNTDAEDAGGAIAADACPESPSHMDAHDSFGGFARQASKAQDLVRGISHIIESPTFAVHQTKSTNSNTHQAMARKVWQFLEDDTSSLLAKVYAHLNRVLILCCMTLSWVDLVWRDLEFPSVVMLASQALFAFELLLRFGSCPNRQLFFFNAYNIIDLCAILTITPMLSTEFIRTVDADLSFAVRTFFPLLMLLKLLRRFESFHLVVSAFCVALEALPVILYTLLLIALAFTGCIYILEPRDNVQSISDAVWLVIITMSTVGFGDIAPVSERGKLVISILVVVSSLYMAIPIGIVGSAFSKVWEDRDRLLLLQQMRARITRAGYTPDDLARMFDELDSNGDRQLSFDEFKEMLPLMRIEMPAEVAYRVFMTFDDDGEGTIDFHEFLLGLYPAHRFFARRRKAVRRK